MIETGYITQVDVNVAGSGLQGDHVTGATTLLLEDASDFNEEGGTVAINGIQYVYTTVDFDTDTLTLFAPLSANAADGDKVEVYPLVLEKTASVMLENSGESIVVRVPHSLVDLIQEGVRDDTAQEAVEVELVNFDWVIVDVMGKEPVIDGSYIGDATVTLASLGPDIDLSGSGGGINIYAQSADPVSTQTITDGDFWLDTTVLGDGTTNILKNRVSGAWVIVQDASVKSAIQQATNAANLADQKMRIYYQTTAPTGLTASDIGDLWFDTDDYNRPYKYNGNANPALAWDDISDGRVTAAVADSAVAKAAALPDGFAPSSSPQPTVTGTIGALIIRWSPIANHDPVTYKVYLSATSGFTPSNSNLVATTMASSVVVKALTDGTALAYGTTYYAKIVASDVDGSAAAGLQASGAMVKASTSDIASDFVYAGRISVERLDGGTLVSDLNLASTIKTADSGARVELGAGGVKVFDSTSAPTTILGSDGNSTFKGDVEANGLTIKGGAAFRSTANEISQGGRLLLAQKTTSSAQAPTVVVDWPTVTLRDAAGLVLAHPENLSGLLRTSAGKWAACDLTAPKYYLWNADGSLFSTVNTRYIFRGLTEIGGKLYGYYVGNDPAVDQGHLKVARLADDTIFTDSFVDLTNWTSAGSTAVVNGAAQVTAASGGTSSISRTITGGLFNGAVSQKVVVSPTRPVTSQTFMRLLNGSTVIAEINVNGPQISFIFNEDGTYGAATANSTTITYDSTAHAYWRITDTGNVLPNSVVFSTSPDGTTWTTQKTVNYYGLSSATTWRLGVYNPGVGTNLAPNAGMDTWEQKAGDNFLTPTNWVSIQQGPNNSFPYFIDENTYMESGPKGGKMMFSSSAWAQQGGSERCELGTRSGTLGVPVSPSTAYMYSVRFAMNGGFSEVHTLLNIDWYNSAGTLISSTSNVRTQYLSAFYYAADQPFNNTNLAYNPVRITATSPATAAYARLRIAGESTSTNSQALLFDNVAFVQDTGTPPPATTSSSFDDTTHVRVTDGVDMAYAGIGNEVPVIGTDGTNIVLAYQIQSSGLINVKTFSTTTFAQLSTANTTTAQTPSTKLAGILRGSFDLGTDSWVVASDQPDGSWRAFPAATNVVNANQTFPSSNVGNKGIAWDGTNFWSLGANGKLYQYTTLTWTTETSSWTAAFTWAGTGGQESTISPSNAFTMKKRARLTVTSSVLPSSPSSYDPTNIKVYVSRDGTMHYQGTSAAGFNSYTMTTINFAGATPPGTNTFLSGVDASIRTQNDNLIIKADGSILGNTITSTGLLTAGSISTTGTLTAGAATVSSLTLSGTSAQIRTGVDGRVTANVTNTTTTYATATGLSVSVEAGKTYHFRAHGLYQSSVTTAGLGLRMNGTATATAIRHHINIYGAATSASTPFVVAAAALTTANARTTAFAATTPYLWEIEGTITVNLAGTLRVEFNASSAGTLTIFQGATIIVTDVT